MAAFFLLCSLYLVFSVGVKSSTTPATQNAPLTRGTNKCKQLQDELKDVKDQLLNATKTALQKQCPATETGAYELSAMRLKQLVMEADLQATKTELRETKDKLQSFIQSVRTAGMTGTTYLRRLADDIKSTLLQGLAEQKQELHTLNTKLAEQCDLGSTSNESTLNMQLEQILNNTTPRPTNCQEFNPRLSGVREIWVRKWYPVNVYCDREWTVFQRRQNGKVDFYRRWKDYKSGFGDEDEEYWLGLETLHQMTSEGRWKLRIDLGDWQGNIAFATYSGFRIAAESDGYRLHVDKFTGGVAGDSLSYENGQQFSTYDKDNDGWDSSCANRYHGAWWYKSCHYSNLNGEYKPDESDPKNDGIIWYAWKGYYKSMKFSQMKIKQI